jgi:hypothetical protein
MESVAIANTPKPTGTVEPSVVLNKTFVNWPAHAPDKTNVFVLAGYPNVVVPIELPHGSVLDVMARGIGGHEDASRHLCDWFTLHDLDLL